MTMTPFDDRVIVEIPEAMKKSAGGIILTTEERQNRGKILAIGTDKELRADLRVGQEIVYMPGSGEEIEVEGKKYMILKRDDILVILD